MVWRSTPEARDFVEQGALLCSRLVDAAAQGRNKQLIRDYKMMILAGIELASDPATTVGLAEVAATLCHTLEMEDAIYRKAHLNPKLAAALRKEREDFHKELYLHPDLMNEADKTIEQVIVSSLGGVDPSDNADQPSTLGEHYPAEYASIGDGHAVTDDSEDDAERRGTRYDGVGADTDTDVDAGGDTEERSAWKNAGRRGVDSQYLRHRIEERAASMERKRMLRTTITTKSSRDDIPEANEAVSGNSLEAEEVGEPISDELTDLEDTVLTEGRRSLVTEGLQPPSLRGTVQTPRMSNIASKPIGRDEGGDGEDDYGHGGASESAVGKFKKRVQDILAEKRRIALDRVLQAESARLGRTSDGNGHNSGRATVIPGKTNPESLSKLLGAVDGARSSQTNARAIQIDEILKSEAKEEEMRSQKPLRLDVFLAGFVLIIISSMAVGTYGFYAVFLRGRVTDTVPQPTVAPGNTREIVIRIVQEVNPAGTTLPLDVDMDAVSQCVQQTIQSQN